MKAKPQKVQKIFFLTTQAKAKAKAISKALST
jgi:hypothetical protein